VRNRRRGILRSEQGFTMVELAAVLAIIAILATIAYPQYTNMVKQAKMAEAKVLLQEVRIDAWSKYVELQAWPAPPSEPKRIGDWTIQESVEEGNYKAVATANIYGGLTVIMILTPTGGATFSVPQSP